MTARPGFPAHAGALLLLAACAHYTPAPLHPAELADAFAARRLNEPGLVRYLGEHGSSAPSAAWRPADLALAALYWQPALDRARAEWRAARAGEITAGARPEPALESQLGYATSSDVFESRWVAALTTVFTLELGGKRGARVAAARARTALAEVELDDTAWRTARAVRDAAVALGAAEQRARDAAEQQQRVGKFAARLRHRYEEGAVGRGELVAIEAEETGARTALAREARAVAGARAALGRTVGVPPDAMDSIGVEPDPPARCAVHAAAPDSVRAVALRRRTDIGRGLAEYAVAEGELRMAVAGASPDLTLGPGFNWDQGIGIWTLALALPRLPFHRNRGPIAEATARRAAAAARFSELQQGVIADVGAALAACRVARSETAGTDSVLAATRRRAEVARAAYERGEVGAGDLEPLELAESRAILEQHAAAQREATAALALDAATGAWPPGNVTWPDPTVSPTVNEAAR
ncbi:MAG TPA: TolC family protein [Gemmatimonadales bacterium]|nr:TolC family protein [Gemmatimonadales bacterium]